MKSLLEYITEDIPKRDKDIPKEDTLKRDKDISKTDKDTNKEDMPKIDEDITKRDIINNENKELQITEIQWKKRKLSKAKKRKALVSLSKW